MFICFVYTGVFHWWYTQCRWFASETLSHDGHSELREPLDRETGRLGRRRSGSGPTGGPGIECIGGSESGGSEAWIIAMRDSLHGGTSLVDWCPEAVPGAWRFLRLRIQPGNRCSLWRQGSKTRAFIPSDSQGGICRSIHPSFSYSEFHRSNMFAEWLGYGRPIHLISLSRVSVSVLS